MLESINLQNFNFQTLTAQYLPTSRGCGFPGFPQPVALSSVSLVQETVVLPPGSVVVGQSSCGCSSNPCGCNSNGNSYTLTLNPCGCDSDPCDCYSNNQCGYNSNPCSVTVTSCGCNSNPCSCNQQLILPPPFAQLPCGCGFSESAIPLVASAYGSNPGSCGTFVEPYYTSACGCGGYGGVSGCGCGYTDPLVSLSLSGNGGCGCGYPGYGVPSVSYVLPSCGCGTANACGCGTPSCGCGLTLATPVCPNLASLAVPIVL